MLGGFLYSNFFKVGQLEFFQFWIYSDIISFSSLSSLTYWIILFRNHHLNDKGLHCYLSIILGFSVNSINNIYVNMYFAYRHTCIHTCIFSIFPYSHACSCTYIQTYIIGKLYEYFFFYYHSIPQFYFWLSISMSMSLFCGMRILDSVIYI